MKTKHLFPFFILLVLSSAIIFSCKKTEKKTSPVQFFLMDSPAQYDSVIIHIKKIEAEVIFDSTKWIALKTKDTIVNLFNYRDSATLNVAEGVVPMGMLKKLRFKLGEGNSVIVNGASYPLTTSNNSADLLMAVDRPLNEVFNGFILDFDASQSIKLENGAYWLEPVIRVIN